MLKRDTCRHAVQCVQSCMLGVQACSGVVGVFKHLNEAPGGCLETRERRPREVLVAPEALQQQVHAVQVHLDLILHTAVAVSRHMHSTSITVPSASCSGVNPSHVPHGEPA